MASGVEMEMEMEDAPPTTWDGLKGWMRLSGISQRDQPKYDASITPKPGKCLAERTAKNENQPSLLVHLRPARWTDAPMDLNLDVLEVVADALMRTGNAHALRALALVNRECATAVHNTLRAACDKLRECAEAFAKASDERRLLGYDDEDTMSATQLMRLDISDDNRLIALDAYEDCMLLTGIPGPRAQALTRKPWSRWFHGSTSLLGHLQRGCELCGSKEARDTGNGAGPVSLFACRKCAQKHCVRFLLVKHWTDRTFHHPKGCAQRLTVRFPRNEYEANSYACALMSKRESHRRRMGGSRIPKARRTVPLSRRVHTNQPWTFELQDSWQLWSDEERGPMVDTDEVPFELWHELPSSIPAHLTFASVMRLGSVGESTRVEADNHRAVRRRVRATMDARRAAFNRIAHTHCNLVRRVNSVVNERGFRAWIQVIELCCAARAFELRWLFKAEESRFGDWRKARYQLLDMDSTSLLEAAHRVSSATDVLCRVRAQVRYADGTRPKYFLGRAESTRACVVEIVKHLPMTCLSPGLEDKLYDKVQHLRRVELRLTLVSDGDAPHHNCRERLLIQAKVDPHIIGRSSLELCSIVTEYTISKVSHLAGMQEGSKELDLEMLVRVQERANDWSNTVARDYVRAELYGLPGAWPCLLTWERND